MRKAFWIIFIVVSLGIGLWVSPIGVMIVGVFDVTRSMHTKESLLNRSDYEDIAQACVSLLLKTDSMRVFAGEDERLPKVICDLHANSVKCTQWEVEIEFHGGFNHFGYRFVQRYRPDAAALLWYTEGSTKLLLELPRAAPGKGREEDETLSLGAPSRRFRSNAASVGCYPGGDEVPYARGTLRMHSDGMVWINVTNMPVPDLIRAIDRECTKVGCDYSVQIRLTGNWQGQVSVLEDKNADPFKPGSKWKTVSKMPCVTVNEERIFITNLLGIIKQHVPLMGVSYLGDGREILITAMPYEE